MKKYKKIAVTGGIGSGKSLAVDALKGAGYYTVSADAVVSELYEKKEIRKMIKEIFPTAVGEAPEYAIDRKAVAAVAFSNEEKHSALTSAVTPLVMEEIERRAKKFGGVTVAEVPLLFECGYEKFFDDVIVVVRSTEERIKSLASRSGLTREQALARIKKQADYDALDLTPYVVIKNDGTADELQAKVLSAVKNLAE